MFPADLVTSGLSGQVVADATPWQGGTVAISNFGFGGSNVHCLVSGRARAPAAPAALPAAPCPVPAAESAAALDHTVRCLPRRQLLILHSLVPHNLQLCLRCRAYG